MSFISTSKDHNCSLIVFRSWSYRGSKSYCHLSNETIEWVRKENVIVAAAAIGLITSDTRLWKFTLISSLIPLVCTKL